MSLSLYLINPASDFPTYFSADILASSGLAAGASIADLATASVAALVPPGVDITICDENITPVDYDHPADWVGITGKVSQRRRIIAIADEFRRRGKRVLIGGPYASLSPHVLRSHCDVLVRGEVEDISAELFGDLRAGRERSEYHGGRPDLAKAVRPRWDLYANERALMGALQTSRGCPFECDFCDVIQYLGRQQRHKPVELVLDELEALHQCGYRSVFLADDNLTVYRRRAKHLLESIARWRRDHPLTFVTQVSVDVARDAELLAMCADAGVTQVFIGLETPNSDSLRESRKRQNLNVDLIAATERVIEHGIAVFGGMIVGFDADTADIFERQYEFAMATAIPIFSLGVLVAPDATPLHARLALEGRLVADSLEAQAVPWSSNIVPRHMTRAQLNTGARQLCNALYAPGAFAQRTVRFIERFGRVYQSTTALPDQLPAVRRIDEDATEVAFGVRRLGRDESRMVQVVWDALARRPDAAPIVMRLLFLYAQIRYMLRQGSYWEPRVSTAPATQLAARDPGAANGRW